MFASPLFLVAVVFAFSSFAFSTKIGIFVEMPRYQLLVTDEAIIKTFDARISGKSYMYAWFQ